ncbi:MAG: molybdopterin biosynthesis protein MoeY [Gammaproteobacteria bacterium]
MDEVRQVLDLARWAPSGDNQQTWRFRIDAPREFTVFAWDTREHCVYDLQGHASQIALGALLEIVRMAASGQGLQAHAEPLVTGVAGRYEYRVRLDPAPGSATHPLYEWIPRRAVQRRPLSTRPLTAAQRAALEAAAGPGHHVRWFESFAERRRMAALVFRSAWLRLTTPEAFATHASVIEWRARFSETRVPELAVGFDPVSARVSEWALRSWLRVRFANRFLGGTLFPRIQLDYLPALACAAHFLIVAEAPPSTVDDYLAAGAAWIRLWLTCASLGLHLQPEMTPLIFCEYARAGVPFSAVDASMRAAHALVESVDHLLGDDALGAVVMGRIGTGSAPTSRSLRRPLDELLIAPGAKPPGW